MSIIIDGEEYVKKSDLQAQKTPGEKMRIVMNNDRGMCVVGMVDMDTDKDHITIRGGRCIIRWGTSGHLAQLAKNGPTENTKLGEAHDHHMFKIGVGLWLDCSAEDWTIK